MSNDRAQQRPQTNLLRDRHHRKLEEGAEALARVTDGVLQDLEDEASQLAERRDSEAPHAARALRYLLLFPIWNEQSRREEMERHARIAVEANGHEVFIDDDPGADVWYAFCSCSSDELATVPTRKEAVAIVGAHAADNDGRWVGR